MWKIRQATKRLAFRAKVELRGQALGKGAGAPAAEAPATSARRRESQTLAVKSLMGGMRVDASLYSPQSSPDAEGKHGELSRRHTTHGAGRARAESPSKELMLDRSMLAQYSMDLPDMA